MSGDRLGFPESKRLWTPRGAFNYSDTTRAELCVRDADKQTPILRFEVYLEDLFSQICIVRAYHYAARTNRFELEVHADFASFHSFTATLRSRASAVDQRHAPQTTRHANRGKRLVA